MLNILAIAVVTSLLATGMVMAQDRPDDRSSRSEERDARSEEQDPRPEAPSGDHRPAPNPGHRPIRPRPPPPQRPALPSWGHRPPHHFLSEGRWRPSLHTPAFRYPPGFSYRRLIPGAIVPPVFLAAPYFYDNYASLGLGPPPTGYRWVRYGPDLLLVNIATGRIADVVDGAFY